MTPDIHRAFLKYGPDIELIASLLDMPPAKVDRIVNAEMDRIYASRKKAAQCRADAKITAAKRKAQA